MSVQRVKMAGMVAAFLGSAVAAHAGGFERSSQDFDILFEKGNVVDTTGTYVAPQRKLKNIHGSPIGAMTGGINPITKRAYETEVDEAKGYWVPKASAKFDLTDDFACAAQYRQPWGIHTDVGVDTVRMYTAIEQKISSHDYGVNCSYRFAAGEKSYFRILGGVSYQELKGEQTRMIPGIDPRNNPTNFPFPGPFRIASLDVEDEAVGWRLGAAYEIPEYAMRATLVYQSKVKYNLEGRLITWQLSADAQCRSMLKAMWRHLSRLNSSSRPVSHQTGLLSARSSGPIGHPSPTWISTRLTAELLPRAGRSRA